MRNSTGPLAARVALFTASIGLIVILGLVSSRPALAQSPSLTPTVTRTPSATVSPSPTPLLCTSNTHLGKAALKNDRRGATGCDNTAIGRAALTADSTGNANTAVGRSALKSNISSSHNTAVGWQTLYSNTADGNTAVGSGALQNNTTGTNNTALGYGAAAVGNTGSRNTALGETALFYGGGATGADTAVGSGALYSSVGPGGGNTAVGAQALQGLTSGEANIALGFGAGQSFTGGESANIDIGNAGVAGESYTVRIGDPQTKTFIAGISGATSSGGVPVLANSSGQLGTATSSARFKDDIQDMGDSTNGLMKLRPVRFRYKQDIDPSGLEQYGLVAEEVAKVYPDLVTRNDQGQPQSVRYQFLAPMLLNQVQKQAQQIEAQRQQIETLTARLTQIEAAVGAPAHSAQAASGTTQHGL